MSAQQVKVLEEVYERWRAGDFRRSFGEDFSLHLGPDFPDAGTHLGVEGMQRYMRGFLEPWVKLTIEAEEMIEGDGRILVRVHQSGTGTSSGAPVGFHYFQLWSFDGTRPVRMESIMDEAEARERLTGG